MQLLSAFPVHFHARLVILAMQMRWLGYQNFSNSTASAGHSFFGGQQCRFWSSRPLIVLQAAAAPMPTGDGCCCTAVSSMNSLPGRQTDRGRSVHPRTQSGLAPNPSNQPTISFFFWQYAERVTSSTVSKISLSLGKLMSFSSD